MDLRKRYFNKANGLLSEEYEEEISPEETSELDRAVQYKYHQDYFQKFINEYGLEGPTVEVAWSAWQKAIDVERDLNM